MSLGPTLAEIHEARARIATIARRTPLERSALGANIFLKLECWQPSRSFKIRGAVNAVAMLTDEERARGIVTASAGNHGAAVALAAVKLGAKATVFAPANAPESKLYRIRAFGAALNTESSDYDSAEIAAIDHADKTGAVFIHAYSDRNVVAGQGTIGLELLEQLPDVANVIVPVGGGGLIAGIGIAMPGVRVIGVQSTETRAMYDAFQAGHVTECEVTPTLADGLAGAVDEKSLARAQSVVADMLLVDEQAIPAAIRWLYNRDGVVAEGSAAVAAAAVMQCVVEAEEPTVLIITGGNIDGSKLANILGSD